MKKGLVLVILLLVLGIGGGILYSTNKKDTPKSQTPQTQITQPPPLTDPSEGGKYLVIKEWGVRFLLPEDLRGDVSYISRNNQEIETFAIVSRSVDLEDCAPIAITRTQKVGFGNLKIGDHYFDFLKAPAACDSQENIRQKKAVEMQNKIHSLLSTLEKTN